MMHLILHYCGFDFLSYDAIVSQLFINFLPNAICCLLSCVML